MKKELPPEETVTEGNLPSLSRVSALCMKATRSTLQDFLDDERVHIVMMVITPESHHTLTTMSPEDTFEVMEDAMSRQRVSAVVRVTPN